MNGTRIIAAVHISFCRCRVECKTGRISAYDQRLWLRFGSTGSLNVYRGVPRREALGLFEKHGVLTAKGDRDVVIIRAAAVAIRVFLGAVFLLLGLWMVGAFH